MRSSQFTRPTLLAAVEFMERCTQAGFNQAMLRLGLENDIPFDTAISVAKKCGLLGRLVIQRADVVLDTLDGRMTLVEALIREAARHAHPSSDHPLQVAFSRGLARDGYVLSWNGNEHASLRAALPEEIKLPASDDEVHVFLKRYQLFTPLGHLNQAIEAHTRGDWAACNGQLRTFLESLFDEIARLASPEEAAQCATAENRRQLLAKIGFFSTRRNEWSHDGKNYISGLFKMLHTDGSHPGLSDEDHSTFRLHVALVTARMFLRRYDAWPSA